MSENKKVHFISLGCPKNRVDSEIMLGELKAKGYESIDRPEEADVVIVNTCGFIEDAKTESIETVLEASKLKKEGRLEKLVVAGCLTQRYKDELVKGLPEADLFVGSGEFQNIPEILNNSYQGNSKKDFYHLPTYLQEEKTKRINSLSSHTAYLKISEGCKKRCAFCAIPMIRGNLQSRSLKAIVSEAKLLVSSGVKEIIIISHDFTDFGWDRRRKDDEATESPYTLLKALSEESGAEWIRVLYLYPDGITDEMIELIKTKNNLVKYFDMPIQHINNQVLKAMNRRMDRREIESVLAKIRKEIPEAVIRTQFIVGFPGETEEQFEELLNFVEEQRFDRVGCFKYSDEEGTKAEKLPHKVEELVINERHDRLMALQQEISREKHEAYVGQRLRVLVDGVSEETELLLEGRFFGQAPDIDGITYISEGTASPGDFVEVEVVESHDYDVAGRII